MQTENDEMEQLSELVRQIAEQVVTQVKFSVRVKDESYSIDLQRENGDLPQLNQFAQFSGQASQFVAGEI